MRKPRMVFISVWMLALVLEIPETKTDPLEPEPAVLLYQGQAPQRIVVLQEGRL